MSVALIEVVLNDDEPLALAAFFDSLSYLLEQVGATLRRSVRMWEVRRDGRPHSVTVILEFPAEAAMKCLFSSPGYARLGKLRTRAFLEYRVRIAAN